ncbi:MAG: hypothetical protein BGN98_13785 [Microbacterium sp. 69-7]|uniref:helicase-related protein n=1 Tax=Microbacterium sp. 69-7 TaxID=1895784 RepID=UPI000964A15A|nr:helicase-related protein [Microbacterium sp. 69-7]OJU44451.1 MAG: hypothetical protein BGN98_13785 [Microbacterium sp. 69-7]
MTKLTPRPEQEHAILRILAEPTHAALIGSQTGFGKTLITSEVVHRAGWERVLYIIIDKTFSQWHERLAAQSDGKINLRMMKTTKDGKSAFEDFLAGKPGHYAATMNWLHRQDVEYRDKQDSQGNPLMAIDKKTGLPTDKVQRETVRLGIFRKMSEKHGPLDAIIHDESHGTANRNSEMRKSILQIKSDWKIALSATWSGNDFAEHGWATPRWLWPDLVPAYWTWLEQFFVKTPKLNGQGKPVYVGGKAMMNHIEREPGAFARSLPLYMRGENAEQAPKAIEVLVDPTPEQARQYAELKAELLSWVDGWSGEREPLVADIPAVLRVRLRQVALAALSLNEKGDVDFAVDAPSAKLSALRGILDAWGGQPVILMTDSRKFAKLTAERMTAAGYRCEAWVGGMSAKEADRIKQAYLSGEVKYIVLTVQAGGTGLDFMQLRSSKIVWLSLPDGDPKLEEQALGRVFRNGMTKEYGDFQHVRLMMRGSLDTEILSALVAKAYALHRSIGSHVLRAA